jgi:putative hemolysin
MVSLVKPEDLLNASNILRKFGGKPLARLILYILGFNRINKIYQDNHHLSPIDFIHGIIKDLGICYEISDQDLENIPSDGPFILIGNHPFGAAEAIITIEFIAERSPDFKYMANFLLQKITNLEGYFIPVNPFETMQHLRSSYSGLKKASLHLQNRSPLGIFPAGEVSTYRKDLGMIADKPWSKSIMKFIRAQQVTVVPIFYEGTNSRLFHWLGKIHPMLRTLKLPTEILNRDKKTIRIKIGTPISVDEQGRFVNLEDYTKHLRDSTYRLGEKNL